MQHGNWLMVAVLVSGLLAGCARTTEQLRPTAAREDAFRVVTESGSIPAGSADLRIVSSFKLHRPGAYLLETVASHGTAAYQLRVTLDGQSITIPGTLRSESDNRGLTALAAEQGEGIRYRFDALLRTTAGKHRLQVALPDDNVSIEREITLLAGKSTLVKISPVYGDEGVKERPGITPRSHFTRGIDDLRAELHDNSH